MYCGDKFDKTHAASCLKRKSAQVNAIVVNDLDHHLTDEVLQQLEIEDNITADFEKLSLKSQCYFRNLYWRCSQTSNLGQWQSHVTFVGQWQHKLFCQFLFSSESGNSVNTNCS